MEESLSYGNKYACGCKIIWNEKNEIIFREICKECKESKMEITR